MKRFVGLGIALIAVLAAVLAGVTLTGRSSPSAARAAAPPQQIGLKVLLISDGANCANATPTADEIAYCDWINTLTREGVPYDTWDTSTSTVPTLSTTVGGTQVANYSGVIVALSGLDGMTTAQYTQLQTFEQNFNVRQLTAYAVLVATDSTPLGQDYGLSSSFATFSGSPSPTLTADGRSVFPYLNKVDFDAGTFGYEAAPAPQAGTTVDTLISGPNNSSLVGIYTTSDGRQTMYQTFNENQYMLQSELLRHGELNWVTRGVYFGDQRNYLEADIDDNFLSDDSWDTTTHATDYTPADALREGPADVARAASWAANNPSGSFFRIDELFNGGGSTGAADPLLTQFKADKNDFGWINHTWDHPNIDEGCANAAYIESEITQNNAFATGSLGLTSGTDATKSLGYYNPGAVVTGEHSGLANLVPGTPGTVDPPEFDDAVANATGGTFAPGSYTYAITDQFSTTGAESSASMSAAIPVVANGSVTITWDAVCHAAEYKIYREDPGTTTWTLVHTETPTGDQFGNTGPETFTWTDTGPDGTAAPAPPTTNSATETAYEQNTNLTTAFGAVGITDFGSDASKPYPDPATSVFTTTLPGEYPAGATFADGGATAIPRYPTNIYYNVSTEAQEVDEYTTLYDSPTCVPIQGVTTCNPAGTTFTYPEIVASIDSGMFQHLMGNDPRPDYFHQTNMMGQPPVTEPVSGATPPTVGDGLFYSTMDPVLAEYEEYFQSNAPIEQLTMAQIGTLLTEQAAWQAADTESGGNAVDKVTASIPAASNVVTVDSSDPGIEMPLTGITSVGSMYGGTQSGWTAAQSGNYTSLTAWPSQPTVPVAPDVPTGTAAPGSSGTLPGPAPIAVQPVVHTTKKTDRKPIYYHAVQVAPKTVKIKHGKVTVSLKCVASRGRTAKGKVCRGTFALKLAGRKAHHAFRIKSTKVDRVGVRLPLVSESAIRKSKHHRITGALSISTRQSHAKARVTRGKLTVRR